MSLFLRSMWRATCKASLKNPDTVGTVAMVIAGVMAGVMGALALSYAFSWTLESVVFWCGAAALGGLGLGWIGGMCLQFVFNDIARNWEASKQEVIEETQARKVAPESPTKGGMTEVK